MNACTPRTIAMALAALVASAAFGQAATGAATAGSTRTPPPGSHATKAASQPAGVGTNRNAQTAELPPTTSDTTSGTRGDRSVQNSGPDKERTAVKSQTKASKATGRMQPGDAPTTAGEAPKK